MEWSSNGSVCGVKMEMYCSEWERFRKTPSCREAIGNSQNDDSLKVKRDIYCLVWEQFRNKGE